MTICVVIGVYNFIHAQSIELVDVYPYSEVEIKSKFTSFQGNTLKHTVIGITEDCIDKTEQLLKNKSLTQLMYWRYKDIEILPSDKENKGVALRIITDESLEGFSNKQKQLLSIGVISNFK